MCVVCERASEHRDAETFFEQGQVRNLGVTGVRAESGRRELASLMRADQVWPSIERESQCEGKESYNQPSRLPYIQTYDSFLGIFVEAMIARIR